MNLIKLGSRRFHQELDYEKVKAVFDGQTKELKGEIITSPYDLYSVETLRDRYNLRNNTGVPTDVFVFGKGEAPDRTMTKIGGLPYWPVDKPWPTGLRNLPLTFLGQINFTDSKDIVGNLPGNILLLFVQHEQFWVDEDQSSVQFEWINSGAMPLIPKEKVPESLWTFATCYGVIHRTQDFRDIWDAEYYLLDTIQGTKIGGLPSYIQEEVKMEGRFLFQLASIQAAPHVEYPWVNVRQPAGLQFDGNGIYAHENQFSMADMASIYVFIQEGGELIWELQSH